MAAAVCTARLSGLTTTSSGLASLGSCATSVACASPASVSEGSSVLYGFPPPHRCVRVARSEGDAPARREPPRELRLQPAGGGLHPGVVGDRAHSLRGEVRREAGQPVRQEDGEGDVLVHVHATQVLGKVALRQEALSQRRERPEALALGHVLQEERRHERHALAVRVAHTVGTEHTAEAVRRGLLGPRLAQN